MDAQLFAKMLSDKSAQDLKKLSYKYPQADMREYVELLKQSFYRPLPLPDFHGEPMVHMAGAVQLNLSVARLLLLPRDSGSFGIKAMEEEIVSTLAIEHIDTSRESVRRMLSGYAPGSGAEERIYGMKKGLEFIAEPANAITEENIHRLYQMTVGQFLDEEDRLQPGRLYRHDSVYVVGGKLEHTGLHWSKLPEYMGRLVDFINSGDEPNELLKAAVIHFYIAYIHPWFDGNGRMARLIHLWYLLRQGYSSALFIPLSGYVERSRKAYYDAYSLAESNAAISGVLDVTPFLSYFAGCVYNRLRAPDAAGETSEVFKAELGKGNITEKEKALWQFVLSAYGSGEFSTKMLERDFGNAAYATIRSFVLKFEELGLLRAVKYKNRVKYSVK